MDTKLHKKDFDQEYSCGIGRCHPAGLQRFLGVRSFIGVFGILSLLTWSLYTITVSQITNMEKAIGLSSSESGWLMTIWELGYLLCTMVASYFGPRAHIPLVMGFATVGCGLSGFVTALPHFVAYTDNIDKTAQLQTESHTNISTFNPNLCYNVSDMPFDTSLEQNTASPEHAPASTQKTLAFALLITGMILQGAGKGPCYPYSAKYIDDSVNKQNTGYYIVATSFSSCDCINKHIKIIHDMTNQQNECAPTEDSDQPEYPPSLTRVFAVRSVVFMDKRRFEIRKVLGSIISSIGIFGLVIGYGLGSLVNNRYVTLADIDIGPKDPRFIGAWWLGFVILGFASMLIALPVMCFPRTLKPQHAKKEYGHIPGQKSSSFSKELKAVGGVVVTILGSPLYSLTLFGSLLQILSFSSFLSFEPKYLETQFAIPAWQSNLIIGAAGISSFAIGSIAGGYISKRLKMTPYITLKLIVGLYLAVTMLMVIMMFLGCTQPEINNPYIDATSNITCDCGSIQYLPICGADDQNYYSPCHAGCSTGNLHSFSNCSLIPGGTAVSGLCPSKCKMLWPYAVIKFFMSVIDAISWVPIFLVFLRTASEEQKALALGLSSTISSALAWMPGPSIGGRVIDSTCLIWKTASNSGIFCGQYDIVAQRYKVHQVMLGFRCSCILVLLVAAYVAKKQPHWRKDEETVVTQGKEKMTNGQTCNDDDL